MTDSDEIVARTSTPMPPSPDQDTSFYWEGLMEHHILLQECTACARRRFPPMPCCPYCGAVDSQLREATSGSVYSWVTVHRAFDPAFADQVPYTLSAINLDGGGRIVGRFRPFDQIRPGIRVLPHFVDHQTWTELEFVPMGRNDS